MRKSIKITVAIAASAFLVLSGTQFASAVPASKAVAGTQCDVLNQVAKGKGVNGSDLTCLRITTGTFRGISYWT